ncbi:MAG: hypothetical protein K1X71_00945 [Pirellulales bacterium]|nr:hypothetical protein [Pirellulales bacterium]
MDARIIRAALTVAAFFALGASYRTPNFVVTAPSGDFAKQVGESAEKFRRELAVLWIGKELPRWSQPCPIILEVGPNLGAGGATTFMFDQGEVFGWHMTIQGTPERILDSVLPHEVTHTIFASHFRRPLPRWADEGACTTVEHESERRKQQQMLIQFLRTNRGIAFSRMFMMRDYPPDVMPLYSQGYSLCKFLIQQGGRKKFVNFVADGMRGEQWSATTKRYYGYDNLSDLQNSWVAWVQQGSPKLDTLQTPADENGELLAMADAPADAEPTFRAQSSDLPEPADNPRQVANASPPVQPAGWHARTASEQSATSAAYPRDGKPAAVAAPLVQPPNTLTPKPAPRRTLLEWSSQAAANTGNSAQAPRQAAMLDAGLTTNQRLLR